MSLVRGGGGSRFGGHGGGRFVDVDERAFAGVGEEEGDPDAHTSTAHCSYVPPPTPERPGAIGLRLPVALANICPPTPTNPVVHTSWESVSGDGGVGAGQIAGMSPPPKTPLVDSSRGRTTSQVLYMVGGMLWRCTRP